MRKKWYLKIALPLEPESRMAGKSPARLCVCGYYPADQGTDLRTMQDHLGQGIGSRGCALALAAATAPPSCCDFLGTSLGTGVGPSAEGRNMRTRQPSAARIVRFGTGIGIGQGSGRMPCQTSPSGT
jgi:hypothetical protein